MKRQTFFDSIIYFIVLSGLTFVSWAFKLDLIGTMVFSLLAFLILVFKENSIYSVPVLFNMLFLISRRDWEIAELPMFYFLIPVCVVIGFLIHYLRFHQSNVHGSLTYPFILLFVGMILSVLTHQFHHPYQLFYIAFGLFYILVYVFFSQTILLKFDIDP